MIKRIESILIGSANAKKLADFYQKVVGLKLTTEAVLGEKGELYGFDFKSGPGLYIMDHSKVKNRNQSADRIIFNLEVDKIEPEFKRLVKAGAKKVQDIYHVEGYGQIATFEDVDGNYFQVVQIRES